MRGAAGPCAACRYPFDAKPHLLVLWSGMAASWTAKTVPGTTTASLLLQHDASRVAAALSGDLDDALVARGVGDDISAELRQQQDIIAAAAESRRSA